MQTKRQTLFIFLLLVLSTALYRIIPFEMREGWLGAPQLAMAIFAGSVIKNRKIAFVLPVFSMLISDLVMQVLFWKNVTNIPGFYEGQFLNYLLIASLTVIGFFISHRKPVQIAGGALGGTLIFFLLSNFGVWAGNGGWQRAKTMSGLLQTYADGLPFLTMQVAGSLIWSVALFGLYYLITQPKKIAATAKA